MAENIYDEIEIEVCLSTTLTASYSPPASLALPTVAVSLV